VSVDEPVKGPSGKIDYVAANGDELFTSFEGGFVSPTEVVGTYEITGGTGRFNGATGSAKFRAVTDFQSVKAEFSGTISY